MTKDDILRRTRFSSPQDEGVAQFLSSVAQDAKILEADVWVDKAHVLMLVKQGIIDRDHAHAILAALDSILESDRTELLSRRSDDIHILLESELIQRLGEDIAGRLHTARSRNDEVAACIRISLRDELLSIIAGICRMQGTLLELASTHTATIMPGYTHLQHAQPTTLGHHLMAYVSSLGRDAARLMECYERVNTNPLGAAAMSSTSFPIDPKLTSALLGFGSECDNSTDAVASRDFALEALACLAIMGINLSRLAEEIILWSTTEFAYVQLSDEFSSTSSIMPQKRNPDVAELSRARISSVVGSLMAAFSVCKSLPLSYNRDLQEATAHLWRGTETMKSILAAMEGLMSGMKVDKEAMVRQATRGLLWATDMADLLVSDLGLPFRTAHSIVAGLAETWEEGLQPTEIARRIAESAKNVTGREATIDEAKIRRVMDMEAVLSKRKACGGPAPSQVRKAIRKARAAVDRSVAWIRLQEERIESAKRELASLRASI